MAFEMNLIDRIDTIRVNSISDEEFERVRSKTPEYYAECLMARWDELQARAKAAIESNKR